MQAGRRPVGSRTIAHGTHDFEDDPRNERILIWVNGELVPRERAVVSVLDAGFVLGDGVWEGLRVRAAIPPSSSVISTACSRARRPSCSTSAAAAAS
jgi:hypothetical protein